MKQILARGHVRKSCHGKVVLDDVTLAFVPGAKTGAVGPNGVGKTTLLKMILGEEQPDAGTIRVGETVRISYVDQLRAGIDPGQTVWEVISGGDALIRAGRAEIPARAYVAAFGLKGAGAEAARPHRVTHRKLTR